MSYRMIPFALPLVLLGCAQHGMVVEHTEAPGPPVSSFDRYHLVVTPPSQATSRHWMIEKAIHDDLRAKGYRPVDSGSAELIVRYDVEIAQDQAERQDATNAAPPPEGEALKTVALTITDARANRPVWHGSSVGEVRPSRLTASLEEAIERILDRVPPAAQARADLQR